MNLRGQFVQTIETQLDENPDLFVLLGDIGVWGMRHAFASHPDRILNIGILEQASVSLASGLSAEGFHPVFHSIAPFVVERAYEQIKNDFCYQRFGGNFVTVGASFDYAALGCTHHCPGDISILVNLPGMEIVIPGTAKEFDSLFCQSYTNGNPTYYRLSETSHEEEFDVEFGKAVVLREGKDATIVCTGSMLTNVLRASENFDVTVLYFPTIVPFDTECLQNYANDTVICVEQFYEGSLFPLIQGALKGRSVRLESIGVPRKFLREYGSRDQHMEQCQLDVNGLNFRLEEIIGNQSR